MISEKGLLNVLKSEYGSKGYTVVLQNAKPGRVDDGISRGNIIIAGAAWAAKCPAERLPAAVAVQIAKDAGCLPVGAMTVRKGQQIEEVLEDVAASPFNTFEARSGGIAEMKMIPVIFKGRWQLFLAVGGEAFAFDLELLKLIDLEKTNPDCFICGQGELGVFSCAETVVCIAPGRFSPADSKMIQCIAKLGWGSWSGKDGPAANMGLPDTGQSGPLPGFGPD
jgi:hypothetical protein